MLRNQWGKRSGRGAALIGATLAAIFADVIGCKKPNPPPAAPAAVATTVPTSRPATTQTGAVPHDLLDVIRVDDPHYPTTQELDVPSDYDEADHVVLHEPIYLCPAGHLWITHPLAPHAQDMLRNLGDRNSHAVRERVLYAHWQSNDNKPIVSLICAEADARLHLVQAGKDIALNLDRDCRWDRAVTLNNYIIVPTGRGVIAINVNDPMHPLAQDLIDPAAAPNAKLSSAVILFDKEGVIAWMPWENSLTGGNGAARFVDGKWTRLDAAAGWPEKILQLVPLLDGSILQLIPDEQGTVKLAMSGFDKSITATSEQQVKQLVAGLSDPDQTNRDAAYEQLTRFGPGIFPLLQKLQDDQPPSAKSRITELLRSQMKLTLGPITLNDGPVATATRLSDGGVVLYCDAGVSIARGSDDKPHIMTPAWLSIRPGFPIEVLPTKFTHDLAPQKQKLFAFQSEWIVGDEANGLRWFIGNHFQALQRKSEYSFSEFIGVDAHGRWLMRTADPAGPTLIVDPNLPDATPHLPAWEFSADGGSAGWTNTNWPAAKKPGTFVLDATGWRNPTRDETFNYKATDIAPPATAQSTATTSPDDFPGPLPTTSPATTQSVAEDSDLILIDKDGTRYFDGSKTIRIAPKNGPIITWNLPPAAVGNGDVWLFHCGQDRFFLFNQPGRVLRLRRTPDGSEPFELETTFTRHIPNADPQRIWLDPAGRIDIAYGGDKLVILFPTGRVPPEIQQLMTSDPDQP